MLCEHALCLHVLIKARKMWIMEKNGRQFFCWLSWFETQAEHTSELLPGRVFSSPWNFSLSWEWLMSWKSQVPGLALPAPSPLVNVHFGEFSASGQWFQLTRDAVLWKLSISPLSSSLHFPSVPWLPFTGQQSGTKSKCYNLKYPLTWKLEIKNQTCIPLLALI